MQGVGYHRDCIPKIGQKRQQVRNVGGFLKIFGGQPGVSPNWFAYPDCRDDFSDIQELVRTPEWSPRERTDLEPPIRTPSPSRRWRRERFRIGS